MRRTLLPLAVLGCTLIARQADAQNKPPLAERVRVSINKGMHYLLNHPAFNSNWEFERTPSNRDEGGVTALATLAILNAGVPDADRPKIEKALAYLRGLEVDSVYARALQTMALVEASLDPKRPESARVKDLEVVARNVNWLIKARAIDDKGRLAGWGYKMEHPLGTKNASTSQYAMLGLWAGKQAGIAMKRELWESIRDYYIRTQDPDGGFWIYDPNFGPPDRDRPSLTMTTAGLAGLFIAGMELNAGREEVQDGGARNCGAYLENRPVAKGLDWLGKHFTVSPGRNIFYHLYGVERAGRLSGLRFFGEHDWYREGSEYLVEKQNPVTGSWSESGEIGSVTVMTTSFALLFLSKGRTPVLMSKAVHGAWPRKALGQQGFDMDWNNDRNDLRNLVQWTSKELFKGLPLAWQTYDMMWAAQGRAELHDDQQAEVVAEMLQSPIFYITGHQSPLDRFTATERNLLKRYIESGGFIFAEACCSSATFDNGFKALVERIWAPDAELTYLDSTHPVWTSQFAVPVGEPYKLMGLNLGCKTVLIYSPQDLSCYWESGDPAKKNGRAEQAFRLGANVIAYATGMQPPRPRLTQMQVASARNADEKHRARGYFEVGQLKFNGDWRPAPKAMTKVMENVRGYANVDVLLKPQPISIGDEDLVDHKFLYLHGRLKPGQDLFPGADDLKPLRFNLENGGLLLADACCGNKEFDQAFRAFLLKLFPKHKLEQVPLNDVLFAKELNGEALTDANIKCRRDAKAPPTSMPPWLEGIRGEDGRWMILYSKYDIGCALEGHQSLGCLGYDPASALKLARAAVLYNLKP
jgi:hypothetical protein